MSEPAIRTTTKHVRAVVCPICDAMPDEPCRDERRRERKHHHSERHERAVELGAPRTQRPVAGASAPGGLRPRSGA